MVISPKIMYERAIPAKVYGIYSDIILTKN